MVEIYSQIVAFIQEQFTSNEFFRGGAVLALLGAAVASFRSYPSKIFSWCKDRVVLTVDITDDNQFYLWFCDWLTEKNYIQNRARRISVVPDRTSDEDKSSSGVKFLPAPGVHYFLYRGRPVRLSLDREQTNGQGMTKERKTTITLEILSRSRKTLRELTGEVVENYRKKTKQDIRTYRFDIGLLEWYPTVDVPHRSEDSLILKGGLLEELKDDIKTFLDAKEWYQGKGLSWNRGYLFEGTPGNGKTSCVKVLATLFNLPIFTLSLKVLSDENIQDAFSISSKRGILLVEDIDSFCEGRKQVSDNLSFSAIINAIDGISCREGRILIFTTNRSQVLDEALIRPGRCDVRQVFGNPDEDQLGRLFDKFFPTGLEGDRLDFQKLAVEDISAAKAQALLLEKHAKETK